MKLAIRGYLKGVKQWEQLRVIETDAEILAMGQKHAEAMLAGGLDMIEIEFLDDPGPDRFFRLGLNPAGMVMPMKIDLRKVPDAQAN